MDPEQAVPPPSPQLVSSWAGSTGRLRASSPQPSPLSLTDLPCGALHPGLGQPYRTILIFIFASPNQFNFRKLAMDFLTNSLSPPWLSSVSS